MSDEIVGDKFCLGNGAIGCDGCGQEKNWDILNEMPDRWRLKKQSEMTRIDDMICILNGRKWRI